MSTTPPNAQNSSDPAIDPASEPILPDWVKQDRRRRRLSRRNILIGVVVILLLGFLLWMNFPFIPDPIILLTRQPDKLFDSTSLGNNWTMTGRNVGLTRYSADALKEPAGSLVWSVGVDVDSPTLAPPVIADGRIFLGSNFRIAVLDPDTGAELDSIPTTGPIINSVAWADGNLYYSTVDRRLVSRDPESGDIRWEFQMSEATSGPVSVSNGIVYAGALNGVTYAVNATTGDRIWTHETLGEVRSPAAIGDNVAYVASSDRSLYALDARTGQERARFRTTAQLVDAPVTGNNLVYFVSAGKLYAMDADVVEFPGRYAITSTWSQLWLWGFPLPPPPTQPGDKWRFAPNVEKTQGIISAPALTEDTIYVGDLVGNFYAVNAAAGIEEWRFQAADGIVASPVVIGNLVVFGDRAGWVYALDRSDGSERWSIQLTAAVRTDPVYAGGRLFVRTEDGRLHAID